MPIRIFLNDCPLYNFKCCFQTKFVKEITFKFSAMDTMKAVCLDKKTFRLTENGELLGTLSYLKWHSYDADIEISGEQYTLRSKSLFSSQIIITKNETEIGFLKMHYDGTVSFAIENDSHFKLKIKGWFFNKYVIEDAQNVSVLMIDPKFSWKDFVYNFDLIPANETNPLVALLGIYSAGYYIAVFTIYISLFVILLI